jgi:two-component system, NarL family, sensor kinase
MSAASLNSFADINNQIDSLKHEAKIQERDSTLLNIFHQLSGMYIQTDNDSALVYANKALQIAKYTTNREKETALLSRIGIIHFNLGNLEKTLAHYNQSLAIANKYNYTSNIAQNYKLIGALHGYQKNYERGLVYQHKAVKIFLSKADSSNISKVYDNIAVYHRRLAAYDSSRYYLNLAIEINTVLNNERSLGFNYNNLGNLYLIEEDYDQAEEFYNKSLNIRIENNLRKDHLQSYNNIGNLFLNKKEYLKAIPYFESCIKISKEIKILKHLPLFYSNLSTTYLELSDYELALFYKQKHHLYTDSIHTNKLDILIAIQEEEIKKSEANFNKELLENDIKNINKLILKKSILITILILILLITIYIAAYSIKYYRIEGQLAKKETSLIALKGAEEVFDEKEKSIQKINSAQEVLKEDIATLLNTEITLKLEEVQKKLSNYISSNMHTEASIKKEQNHINNAMQFIHITTSNLLSPRLEKSLLTDTIQQYLSDTFTSKDTKVNFTCKQPEIINQLEKELNHNIFRIIQELCTNILKYAKATQVNIEIQNKPNNLSLSITDNGVGFNSKNKTAGLGLNNLKYRALLYNGTITIQSEINKGTSVKITMNHKKA